MLNCKDILHPSLHTNEATKLISEDTKFQSWFLVDTLLISCSQCMAVQELIQETSVKLLGVAIDDKVIFMNPLPAYVAN